MISSVAAAVCVVAAGSIGFVIFQNAQSSPAPTSIAQAARDRDNAAAWVAHQVLKTESITCDPLMCLGLEAHGIAASDLRELKPGRTRPPRSGLIIATATVRHQLGARLATAEAPGLIASFGTGAARVEVREIARHGGAAWKSLLRSDVRERRESGADLLTSDRIKVVGPARRDLTQGRVDSRLLVTLAGFGALERVRVLAFGSGGPGASTQVSPLRSADLAPYSGRSRRARKAFGRSLTSFLGVQRTPYAVASIRPVRLPGGQQALRIKYDAPTTLGLLVGRLTSAPGS